MPDFRDDGPRFFGRRHGKALRAGAKAHLETLLPGLAIPMPGPGPGQSVEPVRLFDAPRRAYWLEVGFGAGEHLAWQAGQNPDVGFIGGEVFVNGIASLLGQIDAHGLTNIRIFAEDVRLLMPALPDACLERVFVLFPDPWPKKRHAERRFVSPGNLDQIARLLVDGGRLRIASDDAVYKEWAVAQMNMRADFSCTHNALAQKPEDWPATRYEQKAGREGRVPLFLEYQRVPRA